MSGKYWPKAIAASVGFIAVGTVALLLHNANCLWALILVGWIVEHID